MFERYLTEALTTHFGHFIEGLDHDKVRLSAWNGELSLQDLKIRRSALDHFFSQKDKVGPTESSPPSCPVEIAYGRVGNLEVKIPWKLVRSQLFRRGNAESGKEDDQKQKKDLQMSVVLSDVNVLITPRHKRRRHNQSFSNFDQVIPSSEEDSDSSSESSDDNSDVDLDDPLQKEKLVQTELDAELLRRVTESSQEINNQESAAIEQAQTNSNTWLQERVAAILSNLSVTIKNIHVRYEDPGNCMGFVWGSESSSARYRKPFAIGITLREFSIQTANEGQADKDNLQSMESKQDAMDSDAVMNQKVMAAKQLAAYWDSECKIMSDRGEHVEKHLSKELEADFYHSTFSLLNDGGLPTSRISSLTNLDIYDSFISRHSFVLDPFSPSIRIAFPKKKDTPLPSSSLPPSSMDVLLPACRINISRNLLEDLGYLRKSIDVWMYAKKGLLLPEEVLRRLTALRPKQSPLDGGARDWWKYAYEAVLAFRTMSKSNGKKEDKQINRTESKKRRKGWLGLAQVLGYRRRYIIEYIRFLQQEKEEARLEAHLDIMKIESELQVNEIAAFRIFTYQALRGKSSSSANEIKSLQNIWTRIHRRDLQLQEYDSDSSVDDLDEENDILSPDHRLRMFIEMSQAIEREVSNVQAMQKDSKPNESLTSARGEQKYLLWKSSIKSHEFSLHVNDRDSSPAQQLQRMQTVVSLSFAIGIDQELFSDGSWMMLNRIGSLVVKDCTLQDIVEPNSASKQTLQFPTLLTRKENKKSVSDDDSFSIVGVEHKQNLMIKICRKPVFKGQAVVGSTTRTEVRVLPLEIVYSTKPAEALSRILNTANLEFADDYHRLSSRLLAWRERQQARLLKALAHKQKQIFIDVDVGAPVLLFPEAIYDDSPLLVVDLGRLRFANDGSRNETVQSDYDDRWELLLADIQVQCSSTHKYRGHVNEVEANPMDNTKQSLGEIQQLIEPFSLSISLSTRIQSDESSTADSGASVKIVASLPRLVFNITSSALRLLRRLQIQWEQRKREVTPLSPRLSISNGNSKADETKHTSTSAQRSARYNVPKQTRRWFEFQFDAPLFNVKLTNDVDGRDCTRESNKATTPLLDFALKGMTGKVTRNTTEEGVLTTRCNAKVQTLGAVDLYQRAGDSFALFLSSISPDRVCGESIYDASLFDRHISGSDLVSFEYASIEESKQNSTREDPVLADRLNIRFNELYVEWNPETLAAINKALRLPTEERHPDPTQIKKHDAVSQIQVENDETFFDAEEDAFYDAPALDCIENERLYSAETSNPRTELNTNYNNTMVSKIPYNLKSAPRDRVSNHQIDGRNSEVQGSSRPLQIEFKLSKLRVSFNKESRHRKLFVAEMDGTKVQHTTLEAGKTKTYATIGNLTFSDCESFQNRTLYREILGLKTDEHSKVSEQSSLLEFELLRRPRSRQYTSLAGREEHLENEEIVSIDLDKGEVHGFDNLVRARFSPMRFVYLQQLWLEIVDYFFEGIVGYEVWGSKMPSEMDLATLVNIDISADDIPFTRFDIQMASPAILFPVSCYSTDFFRLEACSIEIKNFHNHRIMRQPETLIENVRGRKQWYNNCNINLKGIQIQSWSGNKFNKIQEKPNSHISIDWPVGPKAPLNAPKWNVSCFIETLNLQLQRDDFALLQHVIQFNISEDSHHLEEWHALQSLQPLVLRKFNETIMVHFGYDKKDVTPTTFNVSIECPTISFELAGGDGKSVAVVCCLDFKWKYRKFKDRVGRQLLSCNVEIESSTSGVKLLYSHEHSKDRIDNEVPDLTYTSTSDPSGDNAKSLKISKCCIHAVYPAWKSLSRFFQGLPSPTYLRPDQVIQVGDRWYKIGDHPSDQMNEIPGHDLSWIEKHGARLSIIAQKETPVNTPSYEFRFVLEQPAVYVSSVKASLNLSMNLLDFIHTGKDDRIIRHVELLGVQVQTTVEGQEQRSPEFSLIRPWSFKVSVKRCNGRLPCKCALHSIDVEAETLNARAAFSDMKIAVEVSMEFLDDMRSCDIENKSVSNSPITTGPSSANHEVERGSQNKSIEGPQSNILGVDWDGLNLVVIDDSGRHFAHEQELIIYSMEKIIFLREALLSQKLEQDDQTAASLPQIQYFMRLHVNKLQIDDCLQSEASPYRRIILMKPNQFESTSETGRKPFPRRRNISKRKLLSTIKLFEPESLPAVEMWSDVDESKNYGLMMQTIEIQYNPSVVIALQRFIGRLAKDVRKKHDAVFNSRNEKPKWKNDQNTNQARRIHTTAIFASVDVRSVSLCLNKEHQGRRLVEIDISNSHFDLEKVESGSRISGSIGDLVAIDPSAAQNEKNAVIVQSTSDSDGFVTFNYRTFSKRTIEDYSRHKDMPLWIYTQLDQEHNIDDYLGISISTLEIVCLRERTEEILDYLSNGMPGRGMGATSRAAKGFVTDRIQKRSFLNVHVDAPKLTIPQNESEPSGLSIRLGDFHLQSWIQEIDSIEVAPRMVKMRLSGFSGSTYHISPNCRLESNIVSNIDVSLRLEFSAACFAVSSSMSDVIVRLSYKDYENILLVYRENLGRRVDKRNWDNLEVAWEKEALDTDNPDSTTAGFSNEVSYSASARHVRYGQTRGSSRSKKEIKVKFCFDSLSLLLRRDDDFDENKPAFNYDMLLIRCEGFEASYGRKIEGDQSANLSLKKIYVFDLGADGRFSRARGYLSTSDKPYSVLVQGYAPPEKRHKFEAGEEFESQIVLKVDKDESHNGTTKITLVVSYLSVVALTTTIRESISFFRCDWSDRIKDDYSEERLDSAEITPNDTEDNAKEQPDTSTPKSALQLRFVLHYPRLILVAEEGDPHSRALVLRGLAIANSSSEQTFIDENHNFTAAKTQRDAISTHKVSADFHDISSYINADVSGILGLNKYQAEILETLLAPQYAILKGNDGDNLVAPEDLGVPLLLPLTVGIEFEQITKGISSKHRSLGVNVDPLSVIVSNEDVHLIQSVAKKLSSKSNNPKKKTSKTKSFVYEVVFKADRLGLGLRKENGKIVVDNIAESVPDESIQIGDVLFAVNEERVVDAADVMLSAFVSRLASEPRPLVITFLRNVEVKNEDRKGISEVFSAEENRPQLSIDKLDLSLSAAVLTLMEKEVPLLRGSVSTSKASCNLERALDTKIDFEVSSTISVEYYNLRIWGWEPLLEPGNLLLSTTFQEQHSGPRELAVEVNDGDEGLSLNITDSFMETFSKVLEWKENASGGISADEVILSDSFLRENGDEEEPDRKKVVSRNAANAAFLFATRQKNDTAKPFIFRNRTGLSVAFVQQRKMHSNKKDCVADHFDSLGGYNGLQKYDRSQIMAVANGEEMKFRVDVSSERDLGNREGDLFDRSMRFPLLTVALQETNGIVADAFEDLQIVRPGVTLVPLHLFQRDHEHNTNVMPERVWVLWSVEQADEKNILTIGSSIRIETMISETLELGVEVGVQANDPYDDGNVKSIGTVQAGEPFCLPLWLAMQQKPWRCSVRLECGYRFTALFDVSAKGTVNFGADCLKCIECASNTAENGSVWLTVAQQTDADILTVTIDCSVFLRNFLPTEVEWEAKEVSGAGEITVDGSSLRLKRTGQTQTLKSGEHAEVLSKGYKGVQIRVRPVHISNWSNWLPLKLSVEVSQERKRSDKESTEGQKEKEEAGCVFYVKAHDALNIPLPIGVRTIRKPCGLDVSLFCELWCTNTTSLGLVFGCPREQITELQSQALDDSRPFELTAAEAALKEISSIFESGQEGAGLNEAEKRLKQLLNDVVRLPDQSSNYIVEDCFEYLDVVGSMVKKRWWASEDPSYLRQDIFQREYGHDDWVWIDKSWRVDASGNTSDGWESSPNLTDFNLKRGFNPTHRFRRRRWTRARTGLKQGSHIDGINAYYHSINRSTNKRKDGKYEKVGTRVAIQIDGGQWAVTSPLPCEGTVYGAIRVAKSRWPNSIGNSKESGATVPNTTVFELCYTISPLDGVWGILSRSMIVASRFLLRNDSRTVGFQVKQTGSPDATAIDVLPGQKRSFHWADFRLPELISVRPLVNVVGQAIYKWSGGFDPLTIGPVPLRIRKTKDNALSQSDNQPLFNVRSIKMESEIRPRTGGTGITLSFEEEDKNGDVALFRVENLSTFPIWLFQDGILSNPSLDRDEAERDGDMLRPSERSVFALDIPFRQGKYSHRKAATMAELLRIRIALAPLSSRAGIETMKVLSLTTVGERVRLNPTNLHMLNPHLKSSLQHVRVVGVMNNDGPTRVLTLRLAEKDLLERAFANPFENAATPSRARIDLPHFGRQIVDGAFHAMEMSSKRLLPSEDQAVEKVFPRRMIENNKGRIQPLGDIERNHAPDLLVSLRASFRGLVVSLIDSSPSEIAVLTFKNMNAIATWNTKRTTDSTVFITVKNIQVDNMVPNAPFPVAVCPDDKYKEQGNAKSGSVSDDDSPPLLVVGLSFAPKHKSGIVCLKSVTIAPRNLAIRVDLAFLVRLQRFALRAKEHFLQHDLFWEDAMSTPDIQYRMKELEDAALSGVGRQKFYFGGLTILPCQIKLSVAPARALTTAQATLEGAEAAAIHQAVRKGDVRLDRKSVLGVKIGGRNRTPLAVVRGMFKSFVVDALLRLDGASLNFAGVSLLNHTSTGSQLTTALGAHYLASLRQNLPALVGSMAAIGNPLGLVKGLGDGVSDFVLEPVKGLQRSVQEMDASYLVDGVAKGTLSLARHTVGGFADSAAMLAETFSKNMTVLTLDRRYAQKRDRGDLLRDHDDINVALGLGSGVQKLVKGFLDGVTGVVKAPMRGAEKRGLEGFAKGIGKGLLGLLVKPIIGISDGFTDFMIGVKGSVEGASGHGNQLTQIRPRRALYGRDKAVRVYDVADAAASALMLRTRLAGELYYGHVDMGDRVALLSVKRLLIIALTGQELLVLKLKHIESLELRNIDQQDGKPGWGIIILLNTPRRNGSEIEVITCNDHSMAEQLCSIIKQAGREASAEVLA